MRREDQIRHLRQQQQEQVQVVENKLALQLDTSLLEQKLLEEQEARARDVERLKRTIGTLLDALDARGVGVIADSQLELLHAEIRPTSAQRSDVTGAGEGETSSSVSCRERERHGRGKNVPADTSLLVSRLLSADSSGSHPEGVSGRHDAGFEQVTDAHEVVRVRACLHIIHTHTHTHTHAHTHTHTCVNGRVDGCVLVRECVANGAHVSIRVIF